MPYSDPHVWHSKYSSWPILQKFKDVNEYQNWYSYIRMGIRIIFEYSMVNNIKQIPTVKRKTRKLMTSLFIIQIAATRFSELSKVFFRIILKKTYLIIGSITQHVDISDSI